MQKPANSKTSCYEVMNQSHSVILYIYCIYIGLLSLVFQCNNSEDGLKSQNEAYTWQDVEANCVFCEILSK